MSKAHILIGVGGGIAAYKVCSVIRHYTEAGHDVRVMPTRAALNFVGAATFEALSGNPVTTEVFDDVDEVAHVALGRQADLVIIAPATADLMARVVAGRADDLLTASLLTVDCPVLFVPAMHTEMWEHPATVDNVATLRRRGATVMTPAVGRLTGADTGAGRMPEPAEIAALGDLLLQRPDALPYDLSGVRMVISAGGTARRSIRSATSATTVRESRVRPGSGCFAARRPRDAGVGCHLRSRATGLGRDHRRRLRRGDAA